MLDYLMEKQNKTKQIFLQCEVWRESHKTSNNEFVVWLGTALKRELPLSVHIPHITTFL